MWLLNFYNKYYLCGSKGKINYIWCELLYLATYLEISKIPPLSECLSEISMETAPSVKSKITIMFFNCTCIYLQFYKRRNSFNVLLNPLLFLYEELGAKFWLPKATIEYRKSILLNSLIVV